MIFNKITETTQNMSQGNIYVSAILKGNYKNDQIINRMGVLKHKGKLEIYAKEFISFFPFG